MAPAMGLISIIGHGQTTTRVMIRVLLSILHTIIYYHLLGLFTILLTNFLSFARTNDSHEVVYITPGHITMIVNTIMTIIISRIINNYITILHLYNH